VFVRWDSQSVEAEDQARLPGYADSVVRRFDAPEALNIRFHEVRTKSALNRVPQAGRLPFEWTVNPYRGCTHACSYCAAGDTPILMADGTHRPLADLRVGDEIYGTQDGRCVRTRVLAHWSTTKPAWRVTLTGGTALVASAGHRFLAVGGWKHVAQSGQEREGCSRMAPGTSLMGPAGTQPDEVHSARVVAPPGLEVVSVEPLEGVMRLYDITTGTGDFIANGVVSHNCFARPTHEYLDMNAGEDFEREVVVKVNVPEVLRAELGRPSWKRERVALGTNTDPYQWVEGRYKLMRGIWEALRDAANPCSILTKSPLVLRDLDLLLEIAARTQVSACLSVPTLEEKAWRTTEPHTPSPRARLEAVAELNRAGIPTGILIAPLMPGINDQPEQVAEIVELATEAGATYISGQPLFLRGSTRTVFFEWLREHRPDLVARYEQLYSRGAYLSATDRRAIEAAAGVPWLRNGSTRQQHRMGRRPASPRTADPPAAPAGPPRPRPVQGALF
jgi:DNA repair photolyase